MKTIFFKHIFCVSFLLFTTTIIHGQIRTCGTDAQHERDMEDPEYKDFINQVKNEIKRLKGNQDRIVCSVGTLTFPVAIHYNWTGIGNTVDQCMIDAAINSINALNDDFLGNNSDLSNYDALTAACNLYYPASAKSEGSCIDFCIAQSDHPSCSGLCDGDLAITAGQFQYPNTGGCYGNYINIFVQSGTGQLGIAPLSGVVSLGGNGPQVDASTWGGPGVLCTPNGLGSTFNSNTRYDLGRTLTHEMGHYFGLQHVFFGDCSSDDGYADTPIQSDENFFTPSVVNCDLADPGNTANNSCTTLDMWCSFMDYCDDTNLFMYSTEQSEDMYANAQLSPIADSNIKCSVSTSVPVADFNTGGDLPVFCQNDSSPYIINFEDQSTRCPDSWSWTFSGAGASPVSSTDENPMVTVSSSGAVTVTLIASNANGASVQVTKTIYVNIADANSCVDCGDVFVDSGGPTAPYSANESNTWTYCADPGEVLVLQVNSIDLPGGLFTDEIRIFDGSTLPSDLSSYVAVLGENNGSAGGFWIPDGGGSLSYEGLKFTTSSSCITMLFESDFANEGEGWDVSLSCCTAEATSECTGNTSGAPFSASIDTRCISATIFDLGTFKIDVPDDSRDACGSAGTIEYANNAFYEVTCDADGGLLEVDVQIPASNTGIVKAYIMGPVTGDCPDYSNGNLSIADCQEATSGSVTISEANVAPDSKYLIFINSENPVAVEISSTATSDALPVVLESFVAMVKNDQVQLSWSTSLEINNDYYMIDRSGDGYDFDMMLRVDSKGNSTSKLDYSLMDQSPRDGQNYYRLSQADLDGTVSVLGYAKAQLNKGSSKLSVFPNPSSIDQINLAGLAPDRQIEVDMYNTIGERYRYTINTDQTGRATIDINSLPNGVYFITTNDGNAAYKTRFVRLD